VCVPIFVSEPPALGLAYRAPLLTGEAGTDQTIKLMRELVDAALADASFVRKAVDIVRSVPAYDEFGELEALYEWAKSNIRFTKDPLTKEKLYPPQELLKIRAGDCDDISMLLGAFALALGYPARLITISANPDAPQEFSHVYVQAEAPVGSGQWVSMDAARVDSQFGVDPPVYFRKRAWSLTEDAYQDLSGVAKSRRPFGLGSYGYVNMLGDGLGDESAPPPDYSPILSQSIAEIPTIISAVAGRPSTAATPYGQYSTSSPYGSFMTPFTPGYGLPQPGYLAPGVTGGGLAMSGIMPWVLIGGVALLLMSRHK
jgi:transglutaminase superfamily protein